MASFERTEKGFAEAISYATWMANFHQKAFALLVHKTAPNAYAVSIPDIINSDDVEAGTEAHLVYPTTNA